MGLRSRRSSTATLKTINTVNGRGGGPQSPRESITEVEEEDEPGEQAGVVEMGTKQGEERRMRLNPKASNSWLRWNSPLPTFPKGKGKGKEVTGDIMPGRRASTMVDGKGVAPEDGDDGSTTVKLRQPPALGQENDAEGVGGTIRADPAYNGMIPAPSEPKAKGWFTKNPPPVPPSTSIEPEAQISVQPSTPTITDEPIPNTEASIGNEQPQVTSNDQQEPVETPGGWKEYLTWGRKGATRPAIPNMPQVSKTETTPSAGHPTQEIGSEGAVVSTVEDQEPTEVAVGQAEMPDRVGDVETATTSTNARQTWGSFLYGIVIPQTGQAPLESVQNVQAGTSVHSTSATTEQPPIHAETDPTTDTNDLNTVEPSQAPPPVEEVNLKPPISTAPRRSSQASTTGGWLNYLAFRASQKKVENPAPSIATEEVMDLSNDPNFPIDPPPLSQPATKSMPPPSGLPDKKKKRLSTSSIKSSTSVVPIPPSPQNQSKGGTAASTPAPSTKISSLPPPPQIPTTQPNLVIPSFTTTFDRPPRSFLPPKPVIPTPPPQPGLAWRALGAVGSYVYPGQEKVEEKVDARPKETRGLKEGREIGTDLPRRIGLGGEDPDDGWKNVKRVVVVGVHGWFPAKIVNSVIGEPTGTSSKFANMMGQAVKKFFDDKGIDDIRLTLIPLEGEGTIEHRVDRFVIRRFLEIANVSLYKSYLSNPAWINDLRRADAIFFAAHSQGCIVTTHLISRLIAQGHIKTPLNAEAVARVCLSLAEPRS